MSNGLKGWRAAIGVIALASAAAAPADANRAPSAREALASAPPAEVSVSSDGGTMLISGVLGFGTASRVAGVLTDAPTVRTVALNSTGGRVREARRIAQSVRSRRLDTSVEALCMSACTFILLAGEERSATPNAAIGFHRPEPVRPNAVKRRAALAQARSIYARAGIAPAFIDRALATPFETVWTPDYETLRAANVLTRRSIGGETGTLTASLASREALGGALLADALGEALRTYHPAIAATALDAAWAAHRAGATDGEIRSAFRAVFVSHLPRLLRAATDAELEEFARLTLEQMMAARRLGPEACGRLVGGRLDVGFNLPGDLVQRETALLVRIISGSAPTPRFFRTDVAERMMDDVLDSLPRPQAAALRAPASVLSPALSCQASITLFSTVRGLPDQRRTTVLRYLFGGRGHYGT